MLTVIFGGAFDPPHNEHVNTVRAAVKELGAKRVVLVPTYQPPHKSAGFLDFAIRAELCRAAFADVGAEIVVDDEEKRRGHDNYASLLLPELKKRYGDIIYLMGGDSLQYFGTWRNPQEIMATCPVAVAAREGYRDVQEAAKDAVERYGGEIRLLNYVGKDVSSARIKTLFLLGECPQDVPNAVSDIIREKGLFREYADTVKKLRSYQSEELFLHSRAALLRAVDLNSLHNLKQNYEQVFLAALLHDNAKERTSLDGLNVPSDSVGTSVLHQFLGAEKAKRDFGIEDEAVLDAIRYHTTGRPAMSVLEKLIYTADSTSYDRDYEPIPALRAAVDENFDEGFFSLLKFTYEKIAAKGRAVYPLTEQALRYYEKERESAKGE